jgi:hypothetical protein
MWRLPPELVHAMFRAGKIPGAHKDRYTGKYSVHEAIVKAGRIHPGGPGKKHREIAQALEDQQAVNRGLSEVHQTGEGAGLP